MPTPEALQAFRALPPVEALPLVLDRMGRTFAGAAARISEAEGPVLVHCRLGKDRTGIMSALLLKLLGVDDAYVMQDYLYSDGFLGQARDLLIEAGESPDDLDKEALVVREAARRENIEAVLGRLEGHYGGAVAYLRQNGVLRRQLDAIKAKYLETAPAAAK